MAQRIQMTIQNFYKDVPEVPMVVEARMEEQVSRIGEPLKASAQGIKTCNHVVCQEQHQRRGKKEEEFL
jgi:hypothetical protein